eukprot:2712542-Amphidinium_carterae.1
MRIPYEELSGSKSIEIAQPQNRAAMSLSPSVLTHMTAVAHAQALESYTGAQRKKMVQVSSTKAPVEAENVAHAVHAGGFATGLRNTMPEIDVIMHNQASLQI